MIDTSTTESAGTFGVLTRLFIRRLVDHDTLSPHADRRESLATLAAVLLSVAVFVTFFLAKNYLASFVLLPGPTALNALTDRFLLFAGSIAIGGLGALMVWDALALEMRDAAILGPLPIRARTIARAKLTAALAFGLAIAVLLNATPSVLYPTLMTRNLLGIEATTLLRLIAAHATSAMLAGLLGFFSVLALRGAVRTLLGDETFRRVSSGLQSISIVVMVTGLLLAPSVRGVDIRTWIGRGTSPLRMADPVLWYLGLNETIAGYRVAEMPVVLPPKLTFVNTDADPAAKATYRALRPRLHALAARARLVLPLTIAIALVTFLWNNRRLPDRAGDLVKGSRLRRSIAAGLERFTHRDPQMEAGFFFALQTFLRSGPHRTVLAASFAVGLTHGLLVLIQSARAAGTSVTTSGPFAISTGLLLALVAGVRHAVTLPGSPGASWTIRLAWQGDERPYLAGVKRAALLLCACTLALLLPLHVALMGGGVALVHSLFGLLFAIGTLDLAFLTYRKLPLACTYLPMENPRIVWPSSVLVLLLTTYGMAGSERWAFQSVSRTTMFTVVLVAIALAVRRWDGHRRAVRRDVVFDEKPPLPTQRLGLYEHVLGSD